MTNNEKQQIAKLYSSLAITYNRNVTNESIIMMVNSLSDLNFQQVFLVMQNWIATETNFPLPVLIRNKIKPELNELDDAREVASRVISAISKFGSYSALEAKKYIGEVGWECVQRFGGWQNLCQEINADNINIMNAQLRDMSLSLIRRNKSGLMNLPINFEKNNLLQNEVKFLINDSFKKEN